jgi:hypothetical protein
MKTKQPYRKTMLQLCRWNFRHHNSMQKVAIGVLVVYVGVRFLFHEKPTLIPEQQQKEQQQQQQQLTPWFPGILDIHHLRVGPSVCSFIVMPDGTTLLIDAGDVDLPRKIPKLHQRGFHMVSKFVHSYQMIRKKRQRVGF